MDWTDVELMAAYRSGDMDAFQTQFIQFQFIIINTSYCNQYVKYICQKDK